MSSLVFEKPIVTWLDPTDAARGKRSIETVEDGFAVLFSSSLTDHRANANATARSEWIAALYHLSNARFDRQPVSIACARDALHRLVSSAGVLSDA
jgi:hypothetical protein